MSDWLSRAKSLFGVASHEPAVPEPVEIVCPCGRHLEAMRRESFQRVLCKNCSESFFLLPLDVYPRPVMKVRVVPGPRRKSSEEAKPEKGKPAMAATAVAEQPAAPRFDLQATFKSAWQNTIKQFTPLRLVVAALLVVIGVTGWWQWNRAAYATAEVDFKNAWDAGNAAIAKQDWLAAQSEFDRAARAVDVLQRSDLQAEETRQRQRELTALNFLLNASLNELVEELSARRQKENAGAAESSFATLYSGRWIVLQTEMTPGAKPGEPIDWEQGLLFEKEGLLLAGTIPAFSQVPPAAENDRNVSGIREVIFAARVDCVRWDSTKSMWIMNLNGASSFLWSHYDLLLAVGLTPDELRTEQQLQALLAEQSRWIGVAK